MTDILNNSVKPRSRSERFLKPAPTLELPQREELIRLFAKYDVPAPRYTSYPPATQFQEGFDSARYIELVVESTKSNSPEISLYLHLPFCDTLCYFCGCTMIVSNNRETIAEYVSYLKREITLVANAMESRPTVVQMHWGGGSPTNLLPSEIEELGQHLRNTFDFAPQAEISIEIDPRGLTEAHIEAMKSVGFNRASIGVQDFDSDVQVAVNRVQPRSITEQVIEWCRGAGMSINLDLIYGLPYQTSDSVRQTLEIVKTLSPDRIAVYNFAYVPWIKPHQKLIPIETLPGATTKLALLEIAISELTEGDYLYLGMDHFAKPDDPLARAMQSGTLHRNFQGYSTLAGKDLYAFGLSAIGRIENTFIQNTKELAEYYRAIDEERLPVEKGYELTPDDEIREFVIMQIMCRGWVEKREVERLFGVDFEEYFERALERLAPLEADGMCILGKDSIHVTEVGRFFLRNIALAFDAYNAGAVHKQKFSQAV